MQRYIDTSFWDDAWVVDLNPSEKMMYMYLLTNQLTNLAGVYKLTAKRVAFDTGLDDVDAIFRKFEKDGKVFRCGEYIILKSWCKHQNWKDNAKIRNGIISILSGLPYEVKKMLQSCGYQFDLSLVPECQDNKSVISGCRISNNVEPENISTDAVWEVSQQHEKYAQKIFDLWSKAGLPHPKSGFASFLMSDFKLALPNIKGLHSDDILAAVKNYIKVIEMNKRGTSWWDSRWSFEAFSKPCNIKRFLPDNFVIDEYKKRHKKGCSVIDASGANDVPMASLENIPF